MIKPANHTLLADLSPFMSKMTNIKWYFNVQLF